MASKTPVKVGMIGYGGSVKVYNAPFIVPNPDLNIYAFLMRRDPPSDAKPGSHPAVDFPKAKQYRSSDEFFADKEIDLVVVNTQHDTHAHYAELALKAGKHVVVEKPFTCTSKEADHLLKVQKESGKILTCYQNRRYDSDFKTLSDLLSRKAFGRVVEFENHYDLDSPPWAAWTNKEFTPGSGIMNGLGSHSLDQALVLFGRPKSITAFLRSCREGIDSESEDAFTVILQYEGEQKDLLVTVKTNIVSVMAPSQLKTYIRGTTGSFIKYDQCAQEEDVQAGKKATDEGFGVEDKSKWGTLTTKEEFDSSIQSKDKATGRWVGRVPTITGKWVEYYADLVAAIRGEKELVVKPQEARDTIRLMELARDSHYQGKTVPWS